MAKKASKKKATIKKTSKKAAKKTSKKAVEPTESEVEERKKEILTKGVRASLHDVIATLDPETRIQMHQGTSARAYREYRLFTGLLDFDLLSGITFGKRIQVQGNAGFGKSLFQLIAMGAMHRTCRQCFTPIITWVDDYFLYQKDTRAWQSALDVWSATGECPFPSVTTCRCGACDPMAILLIDAEDCFDPYWASVWGVNVGDFSAYDEIDAIEGEEVGLRISPDARLVLCRPFSSDYIEEIVLKMIESGAVDAVMIDSLAAFAVAEDLAGKERIASRARFLRRLMPLILSKQLKANTLFGAKVTFLATNQFMQGPVANPRMNPNKAVGGLAIQYQSDQIIEIVSSKINEAIKDGWKHKVVMRDITFQVPKAKVSGSGGGSGDYRVYLDDYQLRSDLMLKAGSTNEAEKIFEAIKSLNDPRVFRVEKTGGGTVKAYWVLERPFKRIKDIVEFLSRRDIQYQLRFILFASLLPLTGRMHLRSTNYVYNPFREEPALKIIEEIAPSTGDTLRQGREQVAGGGGSTSEDGDDEGDINLTLD